MSWSLSTSGSKEEVQKYLDEEAPKGIAHVTGVERTLADQALGLMRATVQASSNPAVKAITVSAYGSATFASGGEQHGQALSLTIGLQY